MTTTKEKIEERERLMKTKISKKIKQSVNMMQYMQLQEQWKSSLKLRGHSERRKKAKWNRRVKKLKKKRNKRAETASSRAGNDTYRIKHWRKAMRQKNRIM